MDQSFCEEDKWVAQWREDELRPGTAKPYRVRRKRVIGDKKEFPTKRLAQRELERLLADVNNPAYRPAVALTFAQFAEQWKAKVLPQMKASTQSTTRSQLEPVGILRCFQPAGHSTCISTDVRDCLCCGSQDRSQCRDDTAFDVEHGNSWGYVTHDPFNGLRLPLPKQAEQPYFTMQANATDHPASRGAISDDVLAGS